MKKNLSIIAIVFFSIISIQTYQSSFNFCFANKPDSSNFLSTMLEPIVQQAFEELQVPGAIIGVWVGDYTPWIATMGVANLDTKQPISIDDKMRIGSITKTFTGTVLLQLVDEGRISLDDKLSKYFPDYPNGQNITIDEIGDMTSGLFNYTEDTVFVNSMIQNLNKPFTPLELVAISKKHPPDFPPGTGIHYSNTNFILLGLIIEKITGNTIQSEIQNRILKPLGMNNTVFAINSDFPEPHAHGYYYPDSASTEPTDVTNLNPSWAWSAGAIISTVEDLQKYAKPLATGQLINSKTQSERLKMKSFAVIPSGAWKDKEIKYGFALASFDGALGHNGGIPGFNSLMGYIPEKDATVIVLVNMQDNKNGIGPADYIARKIIGKIKEM